MHFMQFAGGAAFLLFTISMGFYTNAFIFYFTPWDLVYSTKGTDVSQIEDES